MRLWTLLLNHDADETAQFFARMIALFEHIHVVRIRRKAWPHALLLQADIELEPPREDRPREAELLNGNAVYSGWMRGSRVDRIVSFVHDDALVIDPASDSVIGEYSYAAVTEQQAKIVTDHYATQPVYFHRAARGRWVVSNDLRLVLACPGVPHRVDRAACARFLARDVMIEENELQRGATFFSAVSKLEPASVLTISADGLTHRIAKREAHFFRAPVLPAHSSRDQYVEAFKETFGRCVSDRLAAGAGGLLLSGGIDSGAVLGACLSLNTSALSAPFCVSIAFKDPELIMSHDERLLAALYGTCRVRHEILYADEILRLPAPDDASAYVDGPDSAANPLAKEACAAALQRRGVSLVMTGEGGDVILGEAMHELIVDGLRQSEGLTGLHRYLTKNLGMPCLSAAYMHKLVASYFPSLASRARLSLAGSTRRSPLPAFLKPAVAAATADGRKTDRCNNGPRLEYAGHRYMYSMLFPRASYFDTLNVQRVNSHPFLDPRMIAFALGCPPHVHYDYFNLDRHNPYASAKALARLAYRRELPAAYLQKTHKTSYALMARRMFHNSASTLYALTDRPMLLEEWGLVDQAQFRRQLMAYIVAMEDPNANPGIHYHYMRGVCDLETWLRRFTGTRAQIETRLKLQPLRRLI